MPILKQMYWYTIGIAKDCFGSIVVHILFIFAYKQKSIILYTINNSGFYIASRADTSNIRLQELVGKKKTEFYLVEI